MMTSGVKTIDLPSNLNVKRYRGSSRAFKSFHGFVLSVQVPEIFSIFRENTLIFEKKVTFKGTNPPLKIRRIYPNCMLKCWERSTEHVCSFFPKILHTWGDIEV